MIIDCHGHYTTAPAALGDYRRRQLDRLSDPLAPQLLDEVAITDDEIRASLEGAQLRTQRERGVDCTLFLAQSPAQWDITSAMRRPANTGRSDATT